MLKGKIKAIREYVERMDEISAKLCLRQNWTPELKYVHQTRLVIGFILGSAMGYLFNVFYSVLSTII